MQCGAAQVQCGAVRCECLGPFFLYKVVFRACWFSFMLCYSTACTFVLCWLWLWCWFWFWFWCFMLFYGVFFVLMVCETWLVAFLLADFHGNRVFVPSFPQLFDIACTHTSNSLRPSSLERRTITQHSTAQIQYRCRKTSQTASLLMRRPVGTRYVTTFFGPTRIKSCSSLDSSHDILFGTNM